MRVPKLCALFFLLYLLTSPFLCLSLSASTLPPLKFDDLIAQSRLILAGKVARIETDLGGDKRSIFTFVTLSDLVILRGQHESSQITLRFDGGQIGFRITAVPGIPSFRVADKVVLFIRTLNPTICPLVSCSNGYFKVKSDESTNAVTMLDASENKILGIKDGQIVKQFSYDQKSKSAKGALTSTSSSVKVMPSSDELKKEFTEPFTYEKFVAEIRAISSRLGSKLPPEIEGEPKLEYGVPRFNKGALNQQNKKKEK